MSARYTPVQLMTEDRYRAWADKRAKDINRERWLRLAAMVAIPVLALTIAVVVAGYVWCSS